MADDKNDTITAWNRCYGYYTVKETAGSMISWGNRYDGGGTYTSGLQAHDWPRQLSRDRHIPWARNTARILLSTGSPAASK